MTDAINITDEVRILKLSPEELEAEALALKATNCAEFMYKLNLLRQFLQVRGTRPQDLRAFRVLHSIREDFHREISLTRQDGPLRPAARGPFLFSPLADTFLSFQLTP